MKIRSAVIALFFFPFFAHSQIRLVKDLYNMPIRSFSTCQPTVVNNQLYLVMDDGVHGEKLWKSDGTEDGTMLIKDILASGNPSFIKELTPVNKLLFFTAWDGVNTGRELWKSDGTPAGTFMVKDFVSGDQNDGPIQLTELNGILYFIAGNGVGGRELWRSDGSSAGTFVVKEIAVGWEGVYGLGKGNGKLFFEGYDQNHGRELWVSDGTATGTHELKDIYPGISSGTTFTSFSTLKGYDSGVFFIGDDGVHGKEIWKSDGTTEGTVMVMDFFPGNNANSISISESVCVGNKMFYRVGDNEIWSTSAADNTTTLVKSVIGSNEFTYPTNFSRYSDTFLFTARTSITDGEDLWISDGTEAGTLKLKTINETTISSIGNIRESNNKVYFSADDGESGVEPWVTDGTTEGTHRLFDIVAGSSSSYARDFISYKGQTFFTATKIGFGQALRREDGTVVKDIQFRTGSYIPWPSFSFQDQLFFFDNNGGFWKTDGTDDGTVMIHDRLVADLYDFVQLNGKAFFVGGENGFDKSVYVTDGTTDGTHFLAALGPYRSTLTIHKGFLYFCAGSYLYKSDGTEAGTELVKTLPIEARMIVSSGDYIYFVAQGLWRSDGTEAGTQLIKEIPYLAASTQITASNGIVYFYTDGEGISLWKSDGTEIGTTIIKKFSRSDSWMHENLEDVNGTLFFSALFENQGSVLWKSDGTEEGTVVVKDLHPEDPYFMPWTFKNVNGVLFFTAIGIGNEELWKSDGTAEGTVLVKHWDDNHGISSMLNLNGELFFLSSSVELGWGIGKSDGTEAGTLVYYPQEPGGGINSLVPVNDKIYFAFDSFRYGTEVYVLETAPDILCRDFSVQSLKGNEKVCVGVPIQLNTSIETSNTSLTYTWLKDGNILPGKNESALSISSSTLSDQGTYEVVVSNGTCSASPNKINVLVKDQPVMNTPVLTEISSMENTKLFLQSVPDNYNLGYQILHSSIPDSLEASENNAETGTENIVGADYLFYDRYKNTTEALATVQYTVRPVSLMGCTGDEVILNVQIISEPKIIAGNEGSDNEEFIATYPNPIHNEIRIEFKKPLRVASTVVVYTSEGQPTYISNIQAEDSAGGKIINTKDWKPGLYFLVIRNEHEQVLNRKMLKIE